MKISLTKGSKKQHFNMKLYCYLYFGLFCPNIPDLLFRQKKILNCNKYYFENICPSLILEFYSAMTLSKYEKCVWNFLFPIAKNLRNVFWLHASSLIINWLLFYCSQQKNFNEENFCRHLKLKLVKVFLLQDVQPWSVE